MYNRLKKIYKELVSMNLEKLVVMILTAGLSIFVNVAIPSIALVLLVIFDNITGIKASVIQKKKVNPDANINFWNTINSRGLRRSMSKLKDYFTIILVFFFFEWLVLDYLHINFKYERVTISTVTVVILCGIELLSIDENFKKINGISIFSKIFDIFFKKKPIDQVIGEHIGEPLLEEKPIEDYEVEVEEIVEIKPKKRGRKKK